MYLGFQLLILENKPLLAKGSYDREYLPCRVTLIDNNQENHQKGNEKSLVAALILIKQQVICAIMWL